MALRPACRATLRDRQGALWFGNTQGLSRWLPDPAQRNFPPPILIRGVRRGVSRNRSGNLGECRPPIRLDHQPEPVAVRFRVHQLPPGRETPLPVQAGKLRYRLAPDRVAPVSSASLPPGSYRFLVRAVDSAGAYSPAPAIAAFTILPPYWQSSWFRLLALLARVSPLQRLPEAAAGDDGAGQGALRRAAG